MTPVYPWYTDAEGDEVEQGDLFEGCPVYMPTVDAREHGIVDFEWEERDLIVLSQTCDLVKAGRSSRKSCSVPSGIDPS